MSKKMISLEHEVCDYTCMWRGIEDIYQTKTKEKVPGFLFFTLSGQGEFTYLKRNSDKVKRMVTWGDGRPKKIYQKVNEVIGFKFKHMENTTFPYMLKVAMEQIDQGNPVILGPLDMYYLSYYPKMYRKMHVPNHYVMMVGYDEELKLAYISDCGAAKVEALSFEELEKAIGQKVPSIGGKNGLCTIEFQEELPSLIELTKKAFQEKCTRQLDSKVGFCGIRGMHKLSAEIDTWKEEFGKEDYDLTLKSFVQFTGTVPTLPERLYGAPKDSIIHNGCRKNYAEVLYELDKRFQIPEWKQAGDLMMQSGVLIQQITDRMVEYLLGKSKEVGVLSLVIEEIAELEARANQRILDGIHVCY
ncbi:MAG: BtrH N-terminal domain-containing protein [Clostridiales bacterium]|nr:BtrH N-terminal domain-containing protein [Clostridiales bacterium]